MKCTWRGAHAFAMPVFLPWIVLAVMAGGAVNADDASVSPYIDSLKKEMQDKGQPTSDSSRGAGAPDPYIQSLKNKTPSLKSDSSEESYTEHLKKELGPAPAKSSSESYSDKIKTDIGPEKGEGAIEAVKSGHSELHARKTGDIHNAFGIRIGTSMTKDITSSIGLQPFGAIYGGNFPLDINLFYEYQPWHSEWFGNIGFFGQVGVGYFHGNGAFQFAPYNADTGGSFGLNSSTVFQFFSLPITLGVDYRFNLFRYVRPFVMGGGMAAAFYESRNDGGPSNTADARGIYYAGGVDILLDWVSSTASWDMYSEYGIKHYYLTIDYSGMQTLSGTVNFNVSGIYGGFTFEF